VPGCKDSQETTSEPEPEIPEPLGEPCPRYTEFSIVNADRCARVAGTVRNENGDPLIGATVRLISATAAYFDKADPAHTDGAGHFQLEVLRRDHQNSAPRDTIAAYVRADFEIGEQAVDTSVLIQAIFALEGTRPPTLTTDLVIHEGETLPRPTGRLVFTYIPDGDLFLINADGSGRFPLRVAPTSDRHPVWTPDGQSVLFSLFSQEDKLSLIDADGGNLRPFGDDLTGSAPRWAPDGRHVAYRNRYVDTVGVPHWSGVWVANHDGKEPRRLPTQDDQLCIRECSAIQSFGWYPDADRIGYFVSTRGTAGSAREGYFTTRVSDSVIEPAEGPAPRWSPDGIRLALADFYGLQLRAVDGSRVGVIPGASAEVAWSPTGEWFAYTSSTDGRVGIWIADRDGNRRRRIALDASEPDWQPRP
jgi:hypothetical protein